MVGSPIDVHALHPQLRDGAEERRVVGRFLRMAQGTLADAETTIEELYAWEFDGPHLRDFTGRKPSGARRDAGAIQKTE